MPVELHLVSRWGSARIVPILDELRALLRKYVEAWPGDETFETLCHSIDEGNTQLWVAFEDNKPKFLVLGKLQTVDATGQTRYEMQAGAGEFRGEELHRLADIEKYAAKRGAAEMQISTRPGLCRMLKGRGYYTVSETVRKDLEARA